MEFLHPKTLGARIRELRRQQFLTSAALAAAAGISQPFVIEIEHGRKTPSFGTLERIAEALGVPLPALLDADRATGRRVPVINRASCGTWLDQTDLDFPPGVAEDYVAADIDDPNAFYVRAQGESMTGGRIHSGDLLLISPGAEVRPGDIVLAKGPDGITIKRYQLEGDRIVLQALHPDFADIAVEPDPDFRMYRVVHVQFPV